MEDKGQSMLSNSYGMTGGDGPNSYAQNSVYQRGIIEAANIIINGEITNKLDIEKLLSANSEPLRIADLGCSCGANTMRLHFVFSSCALHWLSKVPKGVVDKTGPAWNKGRIHYGGAPKEVFEAYSDQFAADMNSFLQARVKELAPGALMALVTLAVPDVALGLQFTLGLEIELLGFSLLDMARMGIVSKEKVDAFNVPTYYTSPKELRKVIEGNGCFSIERMEILNNPKQHIATPDLRQRMRFMRAASEILIEKHFGTEIIDQLFEIYTRKLSESSLLLNPDNYQQMIAVIVLLKINIH